MTAGQLLEVLHVAGVVVVHVAGDLQGLLNLEELGGQGQGDINLVSGGQDVLDVLVVDADGAAGLEVALAHHGSLGVQHGAAARPPRTA